jgi:hypothetical protein
MTHEIRSWFLSFAADGIRRVGTNDAGCFAFADGAGCVNAREFLQAAFLRRPLSPQHLFLGCPQADP